MDGAGVRMSDGAGMTGVAELQEVLLATDTLQEFLDEVADRAATEVSPGLSCGLTVRSDGRPLTIASSAGYANKLDQLQYRRRPGRPRRPRTAAAVGKSAAGHAVTVVGHRFRRDLVRLPAGLLAPAVPGPLLRSPRSSPAPSPTSRGGAAVQAVTHRRWPLTGRDVTGRLPVAAPARVPRWSTTSTAGTGTSLRVRG